MKRKALSLVWFALCASLAWAAQHNLVLTGQTKTVQLRPGDTVHLVGDSNQLNLQGDCANFELVGNNNRLRIDGKCSKYDVVGSGNTLEWVVRPGRSEPNMQAVGSNNKVVSVQP